VARHPLRLDRRAFLRGALGGAIGAAGGGALVGCGPEVPPFHEGGFERGEVEHLLPTVGPDRILLKASFGTPRKVVRLRVGERTIEGERTDTPGRFFRFDARGLAPDREYELQLQDGAGDPLCDAWPLRTFPAPDARPERFRLLAYTCAGGPDIFTDLRGNPGFLPIQARRRLLARALAFAPDAAIANGDHVYWDLHSKYRIGMGRLPHAWWSAGLFDRDAPLLGGENERVLKAAFGPQIADLYTTLFRSVPTFFLQDDHDYTENDEAYDWNRTFPADRFMREAAAATQRLYYPELLPDPALPRELLGEGGVSRHHGTLRYGKLVEAWLYDCRRALSNPRDPDTGHEEGRFLSQAVEGWLTQRTLRGDTLHGVHVPSTPMLWTAGKWAEWYPDVQDAGGTLSIEADKPYWPRGWGEQHDRLLAAISGRRDRIPLVASGDLHALGMGRIHRSGALDLGAHPVVSVLTGPISTGVLGWPSRFRGQLPRPSLTLEAEESIPALEQNGFTLLDFSSEGITLSFFRWLPELGLDAIATLEPFEVRELARPPA
jgi:hypothetical protein